MIGRKVMRTLASVEDEIILILGLSCCLSSSSVRCLENVVVPVRMSTLVFVDPESSTQADGAQSSRVPVPLPEDPYEAIRQAYLDGTNTESKPFEDPIDTETPETACMAVRVPHAMSSGLSASMAEVAAMSESPFRKSNLKKCLSDEPLAVLLDEIHIDDKLRFVEEPVEIIDREVKRLNQSRIPIIKVRWNSRRGPEFTWEREDQFWKKYPHLFTKTAPSTSAAS
ncbi:hypothetical protein Tco_0638166 [Tanacetum coccineum]